MNKTAKQNKKEEQKKMMVRVVCMVLVFALAVTSLLAMFPTLFQNHTDDSYTIDELIQMGIVELDEEGNLVFVDGVLGGEEESTAHDHE